MKESKMNVKVIGRDYKETFKDILEEYTKVTKEFDGKYEEREIAIDDGYYIFIADYQTGIWNMSRDELIELWEESVLAEEEEELNCK